MAFVKSGHSLQVHCDGGYSNSVGAATFVVHAVRGGNEDVHGIGCAGAFVERAQSAFHMELTAIDIATDFARDVTNLMSQT